MHHNNLCHIMKSIYTLSTGCEFGLLGRRSGGHGKGRIKEGTREIMAFGLHTIVCRPELHVVAVKSQVTYMTGQIWKASPVSSVLVLRQLYNLINKCIKLHIRTSWE